jgi:hypothetical protein
MNDTGADGVGGDAFAGKFLGKALLQADDTELRGGVVWCVDEALAGLAGGGVDEAALGAAGAEAADRLLAAEEDALGVDVKIEVPFTLGEVLDLRWESILVIAVFLVSATLYPYPAGNAVVISFRRA